MYVNHAEFCASGKLTDLRYWLLHQKQKTSARSGSRIVCQNAKGYHHELSRNPTATDASPDAAKLLRPRSDGGRGSGAYHSRWSNLHPADHAGLQVDPHQMSVVSHNRGGAPVGFITELDAVEAASVIYLRLWCDGPDAQAQVWNDFASGLGPDQGRKALKSFEDLCSLCTRHGRRPLMRHSVQCKCLGADESCFANFIATAAIGEREDAMLIATLLVRPDVAPLIASLAADVGHAFMRMRLSAPRDIATHSKETPKTLH